jgi:hypothetical protein
MSSTTREFPLSEEMKQLLNITRIHAIGKTLFVENAKAESITCPYTGESFTTIKGLKKALVETGEYDDSSIDKFTRLFVDAWRKLEEESPPEEDKHRGGNSEKKYHIQKYTSGIPPAESILIGGTKPMFLQIIDGKAKLSEKIQLPDASLYPLDRVSYLNKEYSFSSEEEINRYIERAKKETLDSIYNDIKSIWRKYVDADNSHIVICAADTIFTYFQDKLGMTHYLLFVGDNNVGKTNRLTVFQQLAYRPLCDVSITPANIYRFLGSVEEGQGIILEDEIDNIDEQDEKMKIYKAGYKTGTKVSRNDDTSSGRRSQGYWTYGFKAFTSEKQPDSIKAKGFNERAFVIKCSAGNPEYDISEVVNPAGDETYKSFLDELVDKRKLLLVYRLLHYDEPIPDIRLNIKNRDKQLCKPLVRLFQNTKAVKEILKCLTKLLVEKKERKANTLKARVYSIVTSLAEEVEQASLNNDVVLTSAEIWTKVTEEIEGASIQGKPQSWETVEYGTISRKMIASILEDSFEAEILRDSNERKFRLNRTKLKRLASNYSSSICKIKILQEEKKDKESRPTSKTDEKPSDAYDTYDASTNNGTSPMGPKEIENANNCQVAFEKKHENDENIEIIASQTSREPSVSRRNASQASQASLHSNFDADSCDR